MKRILSLFLTLVLTAALLSPAAAAANETAGKDSDWLYITLDPGHGGDGAGGNDPGAISGTYGYQEADLVLKIGLYLKEELETYRNVHVDMTRSDRYGTSATAPLSKVENRVLYAAGKGSDLLVSLHLNSSASSSAQGATVLVSNGNYRPEIAKVLDGVAGNILVQLEKLGIQNRDLTKESSHDGTRYPNGKLADYYGIVRYGDTTLPMDEALILTAVDVSGRSFLCFDLPIPTEKVGSFDTELVEEFFTAFCMNAGITLHIKELAGKNSHHIIEGCFKSFARSLRKAVAIDPACSDELPSTKGVLG